jgi:hypothetical protein
MCDYLWAGADSGSAFAQLNGTQTCTVTVNSAMSITSPSGGNAVLAHDTTDANQSFSASDTDWDVISNSGTGATVTAHVPHISITISANMFRWWDVAVFLRERSGLWPTLTRIFFLSRHVE